MVTAIFFLASVWAFVFLMTSQPRASRSLFEPGILVLTLFLACYLAPALVILLGADIEGAATNVEYVSAYGFVFVLVFSLVYKYSAPHAFILNWKLGGQELIVKPFNAYWWVLLIYATIKIILRYYGVGESEDYSDQYLVRRAMPQAVSQLVGLFNALMWVLIFVVLIGYYRSGAKYVFYRDPVFLIGLMFLIDVLVTSSRSVLITYMFAVLGARGLYRKPIGLGRELFFVIPFVLVMGSFALLRAGDAQGVGLLDLLVPSEFIVMYRNALHLISVVASGDYVPPPGSSYFQAFLSFLPKQIYPAKWSLSEWYVGEYFPGAAEAGGGLAFGIVPEAIVNWGMLSMVFQAAVLAYLFRSARESAFVAKGDLSRGVVLVFYLFCISLSYQVVRGHSFAIVNGLFLGFLVPTFILREISLYVRKSKSDACP